MENRYLLAKLDDTGREIMQIHVRDYAKKGYTWFSTPTYRKEADARQYHTLLFMVEGEIQYRAEIVEFHSKYKETQPCPLPNQAPREYEDEGNNTWIKLRNLTEEHTITVNQLKLVNSGNAIKDYRSKWHPEWCPLHRALGECLYYVSL